MRKVNNTFKYTDVDPCLDGLGNFFGKKFLDFGGLTPCQIGPDSSHNYNDASLKPVNTITHRGLFRGGAALGGGGRNLGVGLKKNQNFS